MMSLPLLPFNVSAPVPPVMLKPLPEATRPKSMVTPLLSAVKLPLLTSELLMVALVAVNPDIPVAFAVLPAVILRISPSDKSVIVSVPSFTLNVSLPSPPVKLSFPAPPLILSLPAPPEIMSAPSAPLIISLPEPPVNLSSPSFPVIVYKPAAEADTLMVAFVLAFAVKFAVPSFLVLVPVAVKLTIFVAVAVAPLLTIKTSFSPPDPEPPKSTIISEPESTLNVSAPNPPVIISAPASPWIISSPPSPLRVSASSPPLSESSPTPPLRVSAPVPPIKLKAPVLAPDILIVRPLPSAAVKLAVPPRFFVPESAANPFIPVAFTVAPEETTKISVSEPEEPPKSLIISVPESMLKVSFPAFPVKVSLPAPPVSVSAPASPTIISSPDSPFTTLSCFPALSVLSPDPPVIVYLPVESDISIVTVPDAAVRFAEVAEAFALEDAFVATKPVMPVTLREAPFEITTISPVVKSVIISVPESMLKVSLPAPPVSESLFAPPVMVSAPSPPEMISSPIPPAKISSFAAPLIISAALPPVILSTAEPPVRVNASSCPVKSTVDVDVLREKFSIFFNLLLSEKVCDPPDNLSVSSPNPPSKVSALPCVVATTSIMSSPLLPVIVSVPAPTFIV